MPPKKKKKPDALGQPRAGMRDSAYELGGGGGGLSGGGYSPRRAPKLKPSSARPKLKPFQKPSKKLKLPPPKKPVTPVERATGSRRGVPVGTNQKTNAIKRAAAAPKKPVTPVERATGSRRGVPIGTNQKTNAIKRAAAAKKKTKKNAPKKPVTPSERGTGSRRGVPIGTNQKTNAIKRAAAAKKKTKKKVGPVRKKAAEFTKLAGLKARERRSPTMSELDRRGEAVEGQRARMRLGDNKPRFKSPSKIGPSKTRKKTKKKTKKKGK